MANKVNFTIDQGADLNRRITQHRTAYGVPINLSSNTATVVLRLKETYSAVTAQELTCTVTANGDIYAVANAAVTRAIPPGRYVYDVLRTNAGAYTRLVEGYIVVLPKVS